MNNEHDPAPPDKVGRTLIKAFTFAGAILGVGAIGLAKTVVRFGQETGWITDAPELGAAHWWILGSAGIGFLGSFILVKLRGRS